jgi:hypothetical protein
MAALIRKKMRAFKRRTRSLGLRVTVAALLLVGGAVSYAYYMSTQRLSVNPTSYKPLLNVIAKAESNGNYNAHFGNAGNKKVKFTQMTVAEVLEWQENFVKKGSPSSAVGRYQFINTTLEGLVRERGVDTKQKFDEKTQDELAIALLERRGSEEYVNSELTNKQFAANLAKEWAGLPKVVGDKPDESYYAGDGLNKARVEPKKVLEAIEPIEPK